MVILKPLYAEGVTGKLVVCNTIRGLPNVLDRKHYKRELPSREPDSN